MSLPGWSEARSSGKSFRSRQLIVVIALTMYTTMVGEESHTSYIIPTTPTMRQFVSGYLYLPAMGDVNLAVSDRSIGKIASMTQLYSIFACLCVADVKCAPLQSDRSMSKHYQFKLHDSTTKEIGPSPAAPHRQLFHHFHALVA